MQQTVYTIGHSTHDLERFIALLKLHNITALCDVRSQPYSRTNPQFNREELKQHLRDSGIAYVFLGKELGARSADRSCYENGKVRYGKISGTKLFHKGVERIREGMKKYRLVLMCAEKEPLECHRTVLVARQLDARGLEVQHIHADGSLESHDQAVNRLVSQLNLPEKDMFRSRDEVVADAYRMQEDRIAYAPGKADASIFRAGAT